MSSGRISISAGARQRAVSTSLVAGSVDNLASFLRASTFMEDQLVDVSSSHQTRYLRTDDEEALDSREESIQSDQNAPSRDWSEEESSDTEHPLPPNAIAIRRPQLLQQTSSSLSSELPHSILAHSRPQSTPAHSIHLPETTPLLSPSFQPDSLNPRHSHSRRPRYPGLRQRRSNTSLHGGESLFSRRFSIVSTNLQEAIVEKRGHSTKYQTLFNLINCLIGIGLLAMPLAFADAGWIGGTILLAFASLITLYTAKILASIMAKDTSLETYAEVLISAFGPQARTLVYVMFALELSSLSIALVVLFGDSAAALFPAISAQTFKFLGFFIIVPTTFVPIRFLSITSLIGIVSSFALIFVIFADGLSKWDAPGSLHEFMPTSLEPQWNRLPLCFGVIMSSFSGHALFPSLIRDMEDPEEFNEVVNIAYLVTVVASLGVGVSGYLMFGADVSPEISSDLLKAGPTILNRAALYAIAISPVVKYALASGPLTVTMEHLLGFHNITPVHPSQLPPLHSHSEDESFIDPPPPPPPRSNSRFFLRVGITAVVTTLAIIIPDFGLILSFLGSCSAFLICAIGPLAAYLLIDRREKGIKVKVRMSEEEEGEELGLGMIEKVVCWILLGVSGVMAIIGTAWSFLPIENS